MRSPIYFDHNATAPVRPEVAAAVAAALARCGNPSSVHGAGREARRAVELARGQVAELVGAEPDEIVFVSGGTEANHLALKGAGRPRVLVSAIEHDSVRQAVRHAETIPVDASGAVDLDALSRLLAADARPAIVSIMLANNETGVLQPMREAAEIVHGTGALLHCDAVQAAGKVPVDIGALGADLMSISAHKLGGPQGVGALVARGSVPVMPQQTGGGQERGRRAGTENVPGIVGFGLACALASPEEWAGVAELRDELENRLLNAASDAVVFAGEVRRLPNTTCIAMPGVKAETQVMALDLAGVMVSAGAACSSGKVRPSHVLAAMGVGPALAASAIRISLGRTTTRGEIDRCVDAWTALHARTAARRNAA